jgi:hypothetical protein
MNFAAKLSGGVLFGLVGAGLMDLFSSANTLTASVAAFFVIAGAFNTYEALVEATLRDEKASDMDTP